MDLLALSCLSFDFDFWTKQLCFEKDCKYRSEIKAAFDKIYGTRNIECCE